MRSEVRPDVLNVIDRIRENSPKASVTDVVVTAGVPWHEAREQASEYAWRLPGGGFLITIWGEFVRIHPATGRWFYVESLDVTHRYGGAPRGPLQVPRAEFRRQCLQTMFRLRQDAVAALQVNRLSIAELEENRDAVVAVRVKDPERWHVAAWDDRNNRVVLVRGATDWAPSEIEIEAAIHGTTEVPEATPPWPNQAHRDAVECAAVDFVTRILEGQHFFVKDVGPENRGYDLLVSRDREGEPFQHIEVKGTSLPDEAFFLTRNERASSQLMPTWRLAVVTEALRNPSVKFYSAAEMERRFNFDPLVWRATHAV